MGRPKKVSPVGSKATPAEVKREIKILHRAYSLEVIDPLIGTITLDFDEDNNLDDANHSYPPTNRENSACGLFADICHDGWSNLIDMSDDQFDTVIGVVKDVRVKHKELSLGKEIVL